jgi:hypothetical protein
MISILPQGRLGNQLFQYAFAFSLSRSLRTQFFIIPGNDNFVVPKYFTLRRSERLKLTLSLVVYYFIRLFKTFPRFTQAGWDEAGDILKKAHEFPSAHWSGFFQSIAYFKNDREDVIKLFRPRSKYQQEFNSKYGQLLAGNKKIAILHIRRTDYLDWGPHNLGGKNMTLPMDYYEKSIDLAGGLEDHHTIILSDDIAFVKQYFVNRPDFAFAHNNEMVDLQLLMHANTLILSNSTFAWWGALLNKRNAQVFAPEYWLGFKVAKPYPVNIKQDLDWTWVNVHTQT